LAKGVNNTLILPTDTSHELIKKISTLAGNNTFATVMP